MAQSDPQVNFRCPAGLKKTLELAAASKGRSLNAEIVYRLEASFRNDPPTDLDHDPQALEEAMAFAVGKVFERPGFMEKLAETMLGRTKKDKAKKHAARESTKT